MPYRFLLSLLVIYTCIQLSSAQEPADEEPLLPEVVVEPAPDQGPAAAEATPSIPPAGTGERLPEPVPGDTNVNNSLLSYPDLIRQTWGETGPFGETGGILRRATPLFETPAAGSIISGDRLQEKLAPDMLHALQQEVGVLMQSTAAGQASPFIRGVTGQQVLILIDGIRLNNSIFRFGPNQYFNTIDPGMVDRIEVLRGEGGVPWGSDAIGGVINVRTRSPDIEYGVFRGDYGERTYYQTYNTANSSPYTRWNVEGWAGSTGVFGGASFLNVRDLDTGFGFGRQPGTNYQQYAGDVKLNYVIDRNELLTFALQHVELEDVPRSDRFPGFPGDRNNSNRVSNALFFDPQQRDLGYLRYQAADPLPWIDGLMMTASYHRQREIQSVGIQEVRFQETDVATTGLSLVLHRDWEALGLTTSGFDWYHDDVDSRFGGTATGPIVPDDAFYERFGWFATWDVPLADRWRATAGVRYENIDLAATPVVAGTPRFFATDYQDWISSCGLLYELTPCLHLVGSVAEGFRAPTLDDLTANNPNVLQEGQDLPSLALLPERSLSYQIGAKTNLPNWRSQAFIYWLDLNNNIVPIVAGPGQFERDNQDSYIQGVEYDAEWLLGNGWSTYGNMTYNFGKNLITQAPLSRIPPTQGLLGLRWRDVRSRGYFTVDTWLVRGQDRLDPVRDAVDERFPLGGTPGFGLLNVRMGRPLGDGDRHHISLSLENLTDRAYLVHGSGVFGSGISARFGYRWLY